jgi:hypothetical protein
MEFLRASGLALPVLFVFLIGFILECIHIDVLHTVDLGLNSHIVANVFWHTAVIKRAFGGTTQAQTILNLGAYLKNWYQNTRCNRRIQGMLTLERVRTSGAWPKLKAKAASTRHLIKFCIHLMETYGDGGREGNLILNLCRLMSRFYDILEAESQFFRACQARDYATQQNVVFYLCRVIKHGLCPADCADVEDDAETASIPAYQGNPKYFWTYQDESLVGDMIELCQSVHVNTLAVSALFKWIHIVFGNASPADDD